MQPNTEEAPLSIDTANKGQTSLADTAVERCVRIVANVNRFKQPRLDTIQKYRDLYAGKVKKKFRQPFNVVLPVFSGAMDTLMAAFNDDLTVDLEEQEPADYVTVRKLNALWQMETTSIAPTAKFALKTRQDRSNALFSGRGFMMNYAVSDPEYHNCLEIFELEDAIFQPQGGGHLEDHLYAGRQNVVRSASQLKSGSYDQAQVKKLLETAAKTDYLPDDMDDTSKASLAKFKAMGLDVLQANYVGEQLFKLVEMSVTIDGTRYYIVFSPWYRIWIRFDKLSNIFTSGLYPWVSWATHEDNKNFLTKSYADDMYGVADATHTLFNQELTNREKRNFNARAYDREMFPDVAKLDQAQSRPDALVPADTKGGTRKISEGMYSFETPELKGTIDLIGWMQEETGRDVGVTDLSMGGSQNVSKKATVVIAEQQNISKRLLLRSSPYTEAMAEIAKLFIQGAKDHLPAKLALRKLGVDGEDWEREIKRTDLDLYADVDVRITSSALEIRNSELKKKARIDTLMGISLNPAELAQVNPRWLVEEKLRSGAELDDAEIAVAMDTKNYGSKTEIGRAHEAIQAVQHGQKPDQYYGATTLFLQVIYDFAVNNRSSLGEQKYNTLMDFLMAHAEVVKENMVRKAAIDAAAVVPATPTTPPTTQTTPANPVPNPATIMQQTAATMA